MVLERFEFVGGGVTNDCPRKYSADQLSSGRWKEKDVLVVGGPVAGRPRMWGGVRSGRSVYKEESNRKIGCCLVALIGSGKAPVAERGSYEKKQGIW